MDIGNCVRGIMQKNGWRDIIKRYFQATGLVHNREQFMGRHRQLRKQWAFCNKLRSSSGLGRNPDGTVVAEDDWWAANTKGHPDWKKFRKGLPEYLPEMDRMFEGVAVDGSTSFVATADQPVECDSSDEADDDEDDDELTPLSVDNKRTSSTSTTASSPSKKSRSPAVRVMDRNMSEYNEISRNKLSVLQTMMQVKQDAMQEERKAIERKVAKVNELGKECGVTPSETPTLFMGVLEIIKYQSVMDLFIVTEPEGRMLIIKKYAGVDN
ncbi:L10-interacting MYB domain-containing protein [Oryza sativa Japonica Group]|uniref:L10-interacting MYB domain-containing protein n=1 Tax=Oryza sativa subsp. japonica TaxID=39947 RepID=UPI00339C8629